MMFQPKKMKDQPGTAPIAVETPLLRTSGARSVFKNTSILGVANVLDRLVSFVIVIAIGRELGLVEFGRYSLGVAVGMIVFQICSLGLNVIVKREAARDRAVMGRYLGNALPIELLSVAIGILVVLLFSLVAGYDRATTWVVVGIGVVFAIETVMQLAFAIFEAQERMGYELAIMAMRALLLVCLPIVFAMGYGLKGLIVAWAAVDVLRIGVAFWLIRARFSAIRWQVDLSFWRRLIVESYPLAFALLFNVIYYRIDAVMLSFYRSEVEVGIYNAAYSFLSVSGVLSVAFLRSVFPYFARQVREPRRLSRTFYRSLALMGLAGLAIALILSLFAQTIITVAFTAEFAGSVEALVILAWAGFFMFMSSTCGVLLNATGRQKNSMYVTAGMALVNVAMNLVLIPRLGYIGASYVTLLSYALGLILMLAIIVRDFRRPDYLIALNSSTISNI